jgi:hypothetical protein
MIRQNIEVKLRLSFLLLAQVLDGIFTAIGVRRFGINAEGNPLVRLAVEHYGIPSIFVIKLLSFLMILALYRYSIINKSKITIIMLNIMFWI